MISRRALLKVSGQTALLAGCAPLVSTISGMNNSVRSRSIRCINVINFIRGVEPRFETDLLLPVKKQMELIVEHKLPATWLLQFDALVSGKFVDYLKSHMPDNHEVGFWFEMNEMHCNAAGVDWRGRPGYEWDHYPTVAFTIGYTEAERIKLADTAMEKFKSIWGKYPSSIASWNLDSITMAHLSSKYGIDAYAVCRDQIATDGFTIWGAPIAGYYPSTTNCWSPAVHKQNQISTPVFRMLGQDPVYYYDTELKLPDGRRIHEPDTMEPVWTSGRSASFNKEFLSMISDSPTLKFAYAQLGQENSFPWRDQSEAYPKQMKALAALRDAGSVHVETMGDSGRRFKKAFSMTPTQAQIMLTDPYENTEPAQTTAWYQSRFYRADLHFKGDLPYLRDLTVYSDHNPQPFLTMATTSHDVEQRMPAVLDGFHWSTHHDISKEPGSGGFFALGGQRLRLTGKPKITESGNSLIGELPVQGGKVLHIRFDEQSVHIQLTPTSGELLTLDFEWDPKKSSFVGISGQHVNYRWQNFDYSMTVQTGSASVTPTGFSVAGTHGVIALNLTQKS